MSDDRPVETPEEAIGRLSAALEDLKTTTAARLLRRPTGDIEPTFRATAKQDCLLLQGQTVSRTTYAMLWQWVQEQSLVRAGLFTVGDGSTTFGLPDMRGRVVRGATAGEQTGVLSGSDTKTLALTEIPSHDHDVQIAGVGDHGHNFTTGGGGQHEGHFNTSITNADHTGGISLGLAAWNAATTWRGDHTHGGGVQQSGNHTHGVTEQARGGGAAFDQRQAGISINWMIWT